MKIGDGIRLIAFLIVFSPFMDADQVVRNDGRVHEGEIVSQDDQHLLLQVRVGKGVAEMRIPVAEIKSIKKGMSERDRNLRTFERKFEAAGKNVEKLMTVAEWAGAKRLITKEREVYREVLKINEDHNVSRKRLGYVRHDGKWMTREEKMIAEGRVFFRGHWIAEEIRDEIIKTEAEAELRRNILSGVKYEIAGRLKGKKTEKNTGWNPFIYSSDGYLFHRPLILVPCLRPRAISSRIYSQPTVSGHFSAGNWDFNFRF